MRAQDTGDLSVDWPFGYGFCCCGCGQRTTVRRTRKGMRTGQLSRCLRGHSISRPLADPDGRFWAMVDRSGGPDATCSFATVATIGRAATPAMNFWATQPTTTPTREPRNAMRSASATGSQRSSPPRPKRSRRASTLASGAPLSLVLCRCPTATCGRSRIVRAGVISCPKRLDRIDVGAPHDGVSRRHRPPAAGWPVGCRQILAPYFIM